MSSSKEPIISIKDMVARYGEKTVLNGVSVDILPEEITVILGGSGCGKTTLLKHMLRLQEPYSGSVKFWGEEVLKMEEKEFSEILKRVGMLFQNGALLNSISLYENVSIPMELHTHLSRNVIDRIIRVKLNLGNLSQLCLCKRAIKKHLTSI